MNQSLWIVRGKSEGQFVYLDKYVSWHDESYLRDRIYWGVIIKDSLKKTVDEVLAEYEWEIVRLDFDDSQAIPISKNS